MKALSAMFADAGCDDVRTYIQSGNVVYTAGATLAKKIPSLIAGEISSQFGFDVPVITRTAADLAAVVKNNPFAKHVADTKALHVGFLLKSPSKAKVASLDRERSPGDEFVVRGDTVYFYFPNGTARSKLTSLYFDSTLGTTITIRNWNTVQKLLDMTG
jgi:uncharacterized protein (DUF1697 family)